MSRRSALAAALTVSALAFAGASSARATTTTASSSGQSTSSDAPIPVAPSNTPPTGRRLSPNQVLAIAERLPKMRAVRRKHPGSYGGAYLKLPLHWQVSFFSRNGRKEIGQVIIDDQTARVLEQWTGFQVAWTMARGYPGAFGRHVNALYIWLPLCVLFMLPFFNFRRPLTLLHLDLLVLLSFSVSLAFFNHAEIYKSVPLVYPPLLYLLARMLALARVRWRAVLPGTGSARSRARTHARAAPPRLHLLVPTPWLALGVVFLIGFRVALNVTDSNVIDVGYAGVIGAQRIVDGKPLYGHYPSDNEHGDTYGPVAYESYVPFEQVFGWSGKWDDLPAAHAAAIFFDLLAIALLFLIGRRVRGPSLGIALAYGWAAFPFTLYSLESNSNDTLVAVFVLAALLAATYRGRLAGPARGAFTALAGLTKFAPLAIAPVLATAGSQASDGQGSDGQASDGQASGGEASAGGTQTALRARAREGTRSTHLPHGVHRDRGNREHPGAHARLAAHDLRADARLSGQPRLAVFGMGPVRRHRGPRERGADRSDPARARARAAPATDRRGEPRRGMRGGDHRHAARAGPLVLPLYPVVLPARARGAVRPAGGGRSQTGSGRGIRICSIESARSRREQRMSTPISQGSSSEVSKRTGIWVSSDWIACSRLTPITPPRGPVMPTSVM